MKLTKKDKYIHRSLLILMIVSSFTIYANKKKEGLIDYTKKLISQKMTNAYRYVFIPRPRLLLSKKFVLKEDPTKTDTLTTSTGFVFQYDISRDSDAVKALRKKLNISGLYLQPGSKMTDSGLHWTKMYTNQNNEFLARTGITVSPLYKENGFNQNIDNSVVSCLERLFKEIAKTFSTIGFARSNLKMISRYYTKYATEKNKLYKSLAMTTLTEALKEQSNNENAWIQLLWELEDTIAQETGQNFDISSFKGLMFKLDGLNHNADGAIYTAAGLSYYADELITALWQKYTYYFYNNISSNFIESRTLLDEVLDLGDLKLIDLDPL